MNYKKKILIVGYGQDGKILHLKSLKNKDKVVILSNRKINNNLNKFVQSDIIDITNKKKIFRYLHKQKNLDIYFFATHNISSSENSNKSIIKKNFNSNVIGLKNFLDYMTIYKKKKFKLFYACSSHIFENSDNFPQDEKTFPLFKSEYALVKYLGLKICEYYREKNKIFCNVGILYTHVSRNLKKNFLINELSFKIKEAIKRGKKTILVNNSHAKLDIMLASDAVDAMIKLMKIKKSDTFIISSNKLRSIKDIFFSIKKFHNIKSNISIKSKFKKPKNNFYLLGNNKKLLKKINWKPTTNLQKLVKEVLS